MSAPDDLRQLADRLTSSAGSEVGYDDAIAAAVALRHHANLLDAIGDPARLLAWAVYYDGATLPPWLRALAAAVSHEDES